MTDEEIFAAIRSIIYMLGEDGVTLKAVLAHTSLKHSEILQRFDSFSGLREAAGLPPLPPSPAQCAAREILDLLRIFADRHGANLTGEFFYREAGILRSAVVAHFGSWNNLRRAAGLHPAIGSQFRFTHAELMEDLARVYEEHGELRIHWHRWRGGKISGSTYIARYGSWGNAKKEFTKYRRQQKKRKP